MERKSSTYRDDHSQNVERGSFIRRDSKILNPMHMFRSWKARKTKHPQDHLGRQAFLEKNVTPPFGRSVPQDSHSRNGVHYVTPKLYPELREASFTKPTRCPACPQSAQEEYRSFQGLAQHIMTEHSYVHCNATEFVCTDKMFQINIEDRDYDELSSVQHGFFMSCEESFNSITDIYFHFIDIHCLEDHCDVCGKWMASRRGCLIDHLTLCHVAKNRDTITCPVEKCRETTPYFQDTLRHVIEKHSKVVHVCHACFDPLPGSSQKSPRDLVVTSSPAADANLGPGLFRTRDQWMQHVQRSHGGTLVADVVNKATRVEKGKNPISDKISHVDCVICHKRGNAKTWDNRPYANVRCKNMQCAVDHLFEEHMGEAFICIGCQSIRKYTDVKHLRQCLFALNEIYDSRNIRTDKKLWYAWQRNKKPSA